MTDTRTNRAYAAHVNRRILVIAAASVLLVIVGVGLGFMPRNVGDQSCGSVFSSRVVDIQIVEIDSPTFDPVSPVSAQCQAKLDDVKPWSFGMLGLGVVALVSLGVVTAVGGSRDQTRVSSTRMPDPH